MNHNIIISGAGYTGLLIALCCAQKKIEFTMIEEKNREIILRDDHKAFALSKLTINLLKKLNLWSKIKEFAQPINHIHVFEYQQIPHLSFDSNQEPMGYMIKSHIFKRILLEELLSQPNFKFIENYSWQKINFENDLICLNDDLKAKLLIASEGRHSRIIDYFNLKKFTHDYQQQALVFEIAHQLNHNSTAIEKFFPEGAIAILPLKNGYNSAIVWINNNEFAENLKNLDIDNLIKILNQRLEYILGEISIIGKINSYNLSLSFLKKYYYRNILFMGDANHAIHPIAGQGFNLTVADIMKLMDLLSATNIDIEKKLALFYRERFIPNLQMIGFTHILNNLFSNDNCLLKKIRNLGINCISNNSIIKKIMKNRAINGN